MYRSILTFLFPVVIIISACKDREQKGISKENQVVIKFDAEDSTINGSRGVKVINTFSIVKDTTSSTGNHFCEIDSIFQFGIGITLTIPDTMLNKDLEVTTRAKIQSTEKQNKGRFVVSMCKPRTPETVYYQTVPLSEELKGRQNVWVSYLNGKTIESGINSIRGAELNVYVWMPQGKGKTRVDDLELTISAYDPE